MHVPSEASAVAVAVESGAAVRSALEELLTESERRSYRALAAERRADWLSARVALKEALRRSRRRDDISIEYDPSGAPQLSGCDDLRCSIAHSDGAGFAAVAHESIGADLERVRPRPWRLIRHVCVPAELRYLDGLASSGDELLTLAWTVKEAVLKGLRVGLRIAPLKVRLSDRVPAGVCVEVRSASVRCRRWVVAAEIDRGFALAIALPEGHIGQVGYAWYQPHRV